MGELRPVTKRVFRRAFKSFLKAQVHFTQPDKTLDGFQELASDLADLAIAVQFAFTDVKNELNHIEKKLETLLTAEGIPLPRLEEKEDKELLQLLAEADEVHKESS
jgi:hypothetical protein